MKNKSALVASLLFCAGGLQSAVAHDVGFYIGGFVLQSSKDAARGEYEALNSAVQDFSIFTVGEQRNSFDETDIGFAVSGGYRFTRYIAIEGGFTQFGQITFASRATGNYPLEPGTLATNIETETSGFTLSVLGAWPVTRNWDVFARAGALLADNELKVVVVAKGNQFVPPLGPGFSETGSKSSTNYFGSLGISRRVLEIYAVRLEYQRVFDAGVDFTGGKSDLDAILLGLVVTF